MADATVNIIRKVEIIEAGGHHGGAWKVAYADFMTAMMAFFLLMWILSSSDEQKLRGIAEYFTNATLPGGSGVLDGATLGPPGTLTASNGSTVARGAEFGEVDDPSPAKWEVMDTTPTSDPEQTKKGSQEGHHENPAGGAASAVMLAETKADAVTNDTASGQATEVSDGQDPEQIGGAAQLQSQAEAAADADKMTPDATLNAAGDVDNNHPDHAADIQRFEEMKAEILQAMQASPDLAPLQQNLMFEKTPEGLLIQIIDQQGQPMFASGSTTLTPATQKLMALLGQSLTELPNNMVISGHTDAVPFSNRKAYDNWDLSSDRANAMRRVLLQSGVPHERITRVSGMADTQLLKPEAPNDASNRRIEVLLAYEKPAAPEAAPMRADTPAPAAEPAPAPIEVEQAAAPEVPSVAAELAEENTVTLLNEEVFQNLRSALR
ncbi:flagellar motor protein MotB [Cognatishimia sp. SS12]|uniref:flagellar motor protein MotB n=1 Tax=Cognatishimia sp. SS12 TaxID=2979465 RepID=UPI00232DB218|nr:flagellar motor protein MotB [Cognatishimia sp. SS12]MDC0739449.1 flagellar motor protein MotB [Cognatishimia sp. SS12]